MSGFLKKLGNFLRDQDSRISLQRVYILSAGVVFVSACLINLFNRDLGMILVLASFWIVGIFLFNAISWTLANALIENFLPKNSPKNKKK